MHFKSERPPFGWVLAHKLSHTTKTAHHLDARFLKYGDPKRYFCTFGEKEHTSKRASIIASDNVTSKAKCATRGQQGSSTAKRKCVHFEASVQCDRGTGAHGVRKGGETALFEPANYFPTHKKKHNT